MAQDYIPEVLVLSFAIRACTSDRLRSERPFHLDPIN